MPRTFRMPDDFSARWQFRGDWAGREVDPFVFTATSVEPEQWVRCNCGACAGGKGGTIDPQQRLVVTSDEQVAASNQPTAAPELFNLDFSVDSPTPSFDGLFGAF